MPSSLGHRSTSLHPDTPGSQAHDNTQHGGAGRLGNYGPVETQASAAVSVLTETQLAFVVAAADAKMPSAAGGKGSVAAFAKGPAAVVVAAAAACGKEAAVVVVAAFAAGQQQLFEMYCSWLTVFENYLLMLVTPATKHFILETNAAELHVLYLFENNP